MAMRDPTRPQLDFPALVAELITTLRLTGQVGLLNFSDEVVPTFLIGQRGVRFGVDVPIFNSASVFSGAEVTPAANTVIADTGQLPAGTYDMMINMVSVAATALADVGWSANHRDAANAVTLARILPGAIDATVRQMFMNTPLIGYEIGLNERIRVLSPNVAITSGVLSANIFMRIRPTP